MPKNYTILALIALLACPAAATQIVKNINTQPVESGGFQVNSEPKGFVAVGSRLYFSAKTGPTGREYFYVDGPGAPAQLLADLVPGSGNSNPEGLVVLPDGTLVFNAFTAGGQRTVWSSDGTAAGTQPLTDPTLPGGINFPKDLVVHQGAAYFLAQPNGAFSLALWRTDGTSGGTVEVDSLNLVGGYSTEAQMLVSAGNRLFYTASDSVWTGTVSTGVWRIYTSDGTVGGSTLVKQFQTSSTYGPRELTAAGSRVVFVAPATSLELELGVSDGTANGTQIIDLNPGASGSNPTDLCTVGDVVMFAAKEGPIGGEIFASDGTVAGTYRVSNSFQSSNSPTFLHSVGDRIAFRADDGVHGEELWTASPTPGSEVLYADINPGPGSSSPLVAVPLQGGLVCQASLPATGAELFFSNGTPAGTFLLKDIWPGSSPSDPNELAVYGNSVVCAARDPLAGAEPWVTDGTPLGTKLLADVASSPFDGSGFNGRLLTLGDRALFPGYDGLTGTELWVSDGSGPGTLRLTDFKGPGDSLNNLNFRPVAYRDRAYFALDDGIHGIELWSSDGTATGTQLVVDLIPGLPNSNARPLQEWRGELYFSAAPQVINNYNLFATDGTAAGTRQVTSLGFGTKFDSVTPPVEHQGRLYFAASTPNAGFELWSTDGTDLGTAQVIDLAPGSTSGVYSQLWALSLGPWLYFNGRTTSGEFELFRTDGTAAGTSLFADLNGATSSSPSRMQLFGDRLVFSARSGNFDQYFSTDGITVQQLSFEPLYVDWFDFNGFGVTKAKAITSLRGPGSSGHLWGTDGTLAGSRVISVISPSGAGSVPFQPWPVSSGDRLLFPASNATVGQEIFWTDGLSAGPLTDLAPGSASSFANNLVRLGDKLLFAASDPLTGYELYSLPFSLVGDYVTKPYGHGCSGSNGLEPLIAASGAAVPGGNVTVAISQAAPFAGLLHYWSPSFGLFQLGACSVYLATPSFLAGQSTDATGSAALQLVLPNNPALIGTGLWWQSLVVDPGAEFLGLAALTSALEVRF